MQTVKNERPVVIIKIDKVKFVAYFPVYFWWDHEENHKYPGGTRSLLVHTWWGYPGKIGVKETDD